jgi:hypothetical protein
MVVDDRRKVIFIHIPKCGGISIERSIHKALGGDDFIAYNNLIRRPPRPNIKTCSGLSLHSTLKDYRRYYGKNINDYYIFSFVRNPWRRMVSHYEYLIKNMFNKRLHEQNKMDFSQFVQISQTKILQYSIHGYKDYLEDDYQTKLNFIGKLENINEDLPKIGVDIKLDIPEVLHMNQTDLKIKDYINWRDYYNPRLKNIVYNIFKEDIIKYEYEFEE